MKDYTNSEKLTQEFNALFPAGHSNLNMSLEATEHRLFVDHVEKAHVFDVDGNEYIEYNGAMGPTFLGHGNQALIESMKEFLDKHATVYGSSLLYTDEDIQLAKKIVEHVPCAEQVKFCLSGSEAVQMAIRIARAYTGKQHVIRFGMHYHGWLDNVVNSVVKEDVMTTDNPTAGEMPVTDAHYCEGMSKWQQEECYVLPWNDFEALEHVVKEHHEDIAMIHFEAMICNTLCLSAKPGFIEKIRELCDTYNIVMSIDEVITGWRFGLGGIQEYLGITPDICTMAKAISGGFPFSCVAGKKKIMSTLKEKKILTAGTFNGYAFGVHACLKNIELLEENDGEVYKRVEKVQKRLMEGYVELGDKYKLDLRITHGPGIFFVLFGAKGGIQPAYTMEDLEGLDREFTAKFRKAIQEEGILTMPNMRTYVSGSHTMEDAEITLAAADRALAKLLA
ncbi:MAG: aminotransferase class III-fold pyridoxal phosphate-dependent enzyme [Eubacteriales bacterium]|nr:aminotransferase class III-fold pyridoxal phosphate-dependent enzyme [Eubacteriales bacterium]